jgi:WD40 repeat protein
VRDVVWSQDGQRIASVDAEGRVRIWTRTAPAGAPHHVLTGHDARIRSLSAMVGTRALVAGEAQGAILYWTEGQFEPVALLEPGNRPAFTALAAVRPDEVVAVPLDTAALIFLPVDAPQDRRQMDLPAELHSLAADPDTGRILAPLRNGSVALLPRDGTLTVLPPAFPNSPSPPAAYGADFVPGGRAAVVSYVDGSFVRHSLEGAPPDVLISADQSVKAIGSTGVSVSPDGAFFAASQGDFAFHLYPLDPAGPPIRVPIASPDTLDVAFNSAGTRLAVLGTDGAVYIYRFENGALQHNLTLNSLPSTGAAPAPEAVTALVWQDADTLALAMSQGDVRVVSLDEAIWRDRLSGLRAGD